MATLAEKRANRWRRRGEPEAKRRQDILKKVKILRRILLGNVDDYANRVRQLLDVIEDTFKESGGKSR